MTLSTKWKTGLVLGVVALLLGLSALLYWFSTMSGERFIAKHLASILSKSLSQPVKFTSIETNIFSRVEVTGFQILSIDSLDVPVVEIPLIRLRYSLPKLIFAGLEIDSLIVSSLRIDFRRDSLGVFNLNILNAASKTDANKPSDPPQKLSIKYFALQSGDCYFNDRVLKLGGALNDLSAVMYVQDLSRFNFTVEAGSIESNYKAVSVPLGELRISGNWTSPNLTLDSFSLSSSNVNVAAKGNVSFVKPSPLLSAEIQITGSLLEVLDSLTVSGQQHFLHGDGQVELKTTATGSFDEPIVEAHLTINELGWDRVMTQALSVNISAMKSVDAWIVESDVSLNLRTEADTIYHPVEISSKVSLADSMLIVSEFILSTSEFTIQGGADFNSTAGNSSMNSEVRMKGSISKVADVAAVFTSPLVGDIEGAVDLTLNYAGSFNRPVIRLNGSIPILKLKKAAVTDVVLVSGYRDGKVTLTQLTGKGSKGNFSLNGDIEIATLLHHLNLTVANIDLHSLMSAYSQTDEGYEGYLNANITSSGRLSNLSGYEVRARISLDSVEFADESVPPIVVAFQSEKGIFSLLMTQNDTLIEAYADLKRDSLDCRFSVSVPEIHPFAILFDIGDMSGAIDATGSMTGAYSDPNMDITFSGYDCSYWSFPVDTLRGRFIRQNSQFSFENITASGAATAIDSTSPPFGVSGLAGEFSYSGVIDGPLKDPDIALILLLKKFSYRNIPIESGRLPLTFKALRLSLNDADIQIDSLHISGSADYSFDSTSGSVRLIFTTPEAEIDSLQHLAGRLDVDLTQNKSQPVMKISGRSIPIGALSKIVGRSDIDGRLDISGTAQFGADPRIDSLQITVRDLTLSKAHLDSLVLKGSMSDREIKVSALDGFANGVAFQSKASLVRIPGKANPGWFNPANRLDAAISGSNLDFGLVQPFLPEGFSTAGNCELNLTLKGNLDRPKLEGFLKLRNGRLGAKGDVTLLDSLQGDISVNDTLLLVEGLSGKYKGIDISANSELRFHSMNRFAVKTDLSVNGVEALLIDGAVKEDMLSATVNLKAFDLALIQPMIPGIDALGGIANGDIQISGAMKHPVFIGQLKIEQMLLSPSILEDTLLNCSLDVRFDNHEVALHHLNGQIGGGVLTASGNYLFSEDSAGTRLNLHMADVRLRDTREFSLVIKQVDLSLRQLEKKSFIEGEIVLGETHIRSRYSPQKILSMFRKTERPKQTKSNFLNQFRLDVKVRDSDEIWIDNNLARLRLRADIALLGEIIKPVVSGRISTIEGYVLYLDRKFNVEHGSLDFYDPHRINPNIELLAMTTVKGYNSKADSLHIISLSITGEIDKAVVTLTSNPPEDVSDIISLLTLGITRRDLTGVDGKEGDVKFQEAVRERLELITSRRVSGYIASNVEDALGLTSFTIENNLFNFDKNWGPQLVASKKLSSRAVITYTTTVGRINDQGIKLAYKLTERFAIEGETDQVGRSGIDLIYKLKLP